MKISVILEALTGSFETDIKRAEKASSKAARQMEADFKRAGAAIGVAAVAAGGAVAAMVKNAINAADEMNDLSQRFGVAVEKLSGFKLAADQSGTSIEGLARGMQKLAKEAANNSDALAAMGIDAKDASGNLKGNNSCFPAMNNFTRQKKDSGNI